VRFIQTHKGATLEAIVYPILLVILLWGIFLLDRMYELNLYKLGLKPNTAEGIKGIFLMPFIHGQRDFSHIINNSVPTLVLLSTLIYFYRSIAHYVLLFIWLGTGFLLWFLVGEGNSYHIGISGIIYGLFGFLFMSGFLRRYLPLQAISLFVVFLYGSLVWGIFPGEPGISWQGHFLGLTVGVIVALAFRKQGPQRPKYQYEIEKELGIPPPDLEGEWLRRVEEIRAIQEKHKEEQENQYASFKIIYDYKRNDENKEKS
jgi:membrane associated rhomboid family serine protease